MSRIYMTLLGLGLFCYLQAQTPADGFKMRKGEICVMAVFQQDQWDQYWENQLKRENLNLGTVSTRSIVPMFALGITENLNLMAMLPYVWTEASAGVLAGHEGFQDLGVWLKFKPYQLNVGSSRLETFLSGGVSTPVGNYYPDYLPLSIGLGSTVGSLKGVVHFQTGGGFYVSAQGGYSYRSNIKLERSYYYTDRGYAAEEAEMPSVLDYSAMLGFINTTLRLEAGYSVMNTLGGSNIRRNDMPFPAYNMDAQRVGIMGQYRPKFLRGAGFTANAGYVLNGRNVGQSTMFGAGVLWQFFVWKPDSKSEVGSRKSESGPFVD